LRDATVLASLLTQASHSDTLATFARARRADRSATIRLTDVMARVFASAPMARHHKRCSVVSLGLVDVLTPARRVLAEQMMFGRR